MAGLPGGAARGVQAAGVAVAERGVGQGVGGLAQNDWGEAGGGVLGDGPVVGEVAAAALGGAGEQRQGGRLSGARPGLQGQVVASVEGVGCGALLIGRVQHGAAGGAAQGVPDGRQEAGGAGAGEEEALYGVIEEVGFVAGVLGQGAAEGGTKKLGLPRLVGGVPDGGMEGGWEGEVEQDLAVRVRVVGGDRVDGQPCAEALAQAVRGPAGVFARTRAIGGWRRGWPRAAARGRRRGVRLG